MAILRPAKYEHNNPNLPIVDIDNIWGGCFVLTGSTEQERYDLPPTKLKNKQLVKNTIGELWELTDINQSTNTNGWTIFSSSGATSGCCHDAVVYTNSAATLVTIGGVEVGSTFSGCTMQNMWDDLLYPELTPSFTIFNMVGNDVAVDVGYTLIAGSKDWAWRNTWDQFVNTDSVKIYDETNHTWLATGLLDGPLITTAAVDTPIDIQKTARLRHTWYVQAQRTNNAWFTRYYHMDWYWRRYFVDNANPDLTALEITNLSSGELSNLVTGDFNFPPNNTYKYLVIPVESGHIPVAGNPHHHWYGKRPEAIKDISTNLNIALAGPLDGYNDTVNLAGIGWPDIPTDLPCKLISIDNTNGFPTMYYVFRTKYKLGGNITIRVI